MERDIRPFFEEWEESSKIPRDLLVKCAKEGVFALIIGRPWPEEIFPKKVVLGVELKNPDSFHEQILSDEINKIGTSSIITAFGTGTAVGVPPPI